MSVKNIPTSKMNTVFSHIGEINAFHKHSSFATTINEGVLIPSISPCTNFAFRIGYFLWMMRGDNKLEPLMHYTKHMQDLSDDFHHLRGAIGPRLSQWIGADHLQEAIRINQEIDTDPEKDERDFVKPKGVNQLRASYEDLLDPNIMTSVMNVFDPAIDFEATNYVPDVVSIMWKKRIDSKVLDAMVCFNVFDPSINSINDLFAIRMLHMCMSNWIGHEMGSLTLVANEIDFSQEFHQQILFFSGFEDDSELETSFEEFWHDIQKLSQMEMHMRCMVNESSFETPEVAVMQLTESLEDVLIKPIYDKFWKNCGYGLLIFSVKEHGPQHPMYEDYIHETLQKMSGALQKDVAWWLLRKGDIPFKTKQFIENELKVF